MRSALFAALGMLMLVMPAAPSWSADGRPVNRAGAEHYVWGEINAGWHLLKSADISIIEEEMAPGGREVPHFHERARQFFYVLRGTLSMRRGAESVTVPAGSGLEIPPGQVHQALNTTDEAIAFLVVSVPPSHGDRVVVTFDAAAEQRLAGEDAKQPVAALQPDRDIAALRAASALWVETYNRNDWDALAQLFTQDAVMMPPNGALVRGREAIARWERANESGFRIAFQIEDIQRAGDTAYVRGASCVFIPSAQGPPGVDVGKFLEVRVRQPGGAWLISADIFNSDAAPGAPLAETCPFQSDD